jgi:F-type H+-transporting ATPase subunit a
VKALIIAGVVLALLVVGKFVLVLPPPVIIVSPEVIWHTRWFDITNTMFTSWVVVAFILIVAVVAGRGAKVVPSGFAAYVEAAVMALYGIVEQVAGPQNGRRFFPLIGTIFFFILISNYFGLLPVNAVIGLTEPGHGDRTQAVFHQTSIGPLDVAYLPLQTETRDIRGGEPMLLPAGYGADAEPGHGALPGATSPEYVAVPMALAASQAMRAAEGEIERSQDGSFSGILAPAFRSVMTDINAPLAIAIFSFIFVEFWGLQSLGAGYLTKFFAFGALLRKGPMGLIDVFVGILEFVSELSRMVSFTFRLFGNIFAGEVLLLMMTFLVPLVLVNVFYGLELFVGLIQAFVFAMLTLVFAVTAVSHHSADQHVDEGHEAHDPHGVDSQMAPAH